VKQLKNGNFILEDRPELILTPEEFDKFKKLISSETGLVHMFIIFCDYT